MTVIEFQPPHSATPSGPELAAELGAQDLAALTDAELVDHLAASRRLASWVQAGELAAAAELARRRPVYPYERAFLDGEYATPDGLPITEFVVDEVRGALTLTGNAAMELIELGLALQERLPATGQALRQGIIDLPKAKVIARGTTGTAEHLARRVEQRVLPTAPAQTTGELRTAVTRSVLAADPGAADRRRKTSEATRGVSLRHDDEGTATLAGWNLPADQAIAAANRLNAIARAFKTDGDQRRLDNIRADVFLALLLGLLPTHPTPLPTQTQPTPAQPARPAAPPNPADDDAPTNDAPRTDAAHRPPNLAATHQPRPPGNLTPANDAARTQPAHPASALSWADPTRADNTTRTDATRTDTARASGSPTPTGSTALTRATRPTAGPAPADDAARTRSAHPAARSSAGLTSAGGGPGSVDDADGVGAAYLAAPCSSGSPVLGDDDARTGLAHRASDPTATDQPHLSSSPAPADDAARTRSAHPAARSSAGPALANGCAPTDVACQETDLAAADLAAADLAAAGQACPSGRPAPTDSAAHAQTVQSAAGRSAAGSACGGGAGGTATAQSAAGLTGRAERPGVGGQAGEVGEVRAWYEEPDEEFGVPDVAPAREAELAARAGAQVGTVHLTVPLLTFVGLASHPGQVAGYGPVLADVARMLAESATAKGTRWCVTVVDGDGEPLVHGETRYRPSVKMQRAVQCRDQTCRFPGCRRAAYRCDLDHTIPHDRNGPTCPCNLSALCRRHHRLKQREGWELHQISPGVLVWTTPTGHGYVVRPDPYPTE